MNYNPHGVHVSQGSQSPWIQSIHTRRAASLPLEPSSHPVGKSDAHAPHMMSQHPLYILADLIESPSSHPILPAPSTEGIPTLLHLNSTTRPALPSNNHLCDDYTPGSTLYASYP